MSSYHFSSRKIEGSKFTLANGGSNLIVRNLDSSDAGTFECVAKSSAGEARALGYFTIRDPYGLFYLRLFVFRHLSIFI